MCKDEVLLSVVLLSYNHKKYIGKCLDGILMQKTSFRYEVIIGDDASADGTADVIREYVKRHGGIIKAVFREKNIGAVANLEDLLSRSRSLYIAGCEGDDFWTDRYKLQKQVDFLENHRDYIGVSHEIITVNEQDERVEKTIEWISKNRDYTLSDFKGIFLPGHPVALVFRNIFLKEVNPSLLSQIHENIADRSIALLLVLRGKIYRLDDCMAAYRVRNSKSTSFDNLTNILYLNAYHYVDDYKINTKLEDLASAYKGKKIRFTSYRYNLLLRATLKLLVYPNACHFRVWKELLHCHIAWFYREKNGEIIR